MIEAELCLQYDQQCVLSELAKELGDRSRLEIGIEKMHDQQVTLIVDIGSSADMSECMEILAENHSVTNVNIINKRAVIVTKESCGAYSAIYQNDGILWRQNYITDVQRIYTALVFNREQLKDIITDFREHGKITADKIKSIGVGDAKQEIAAETRQPSLTERQREVLEHAYERGYFHWPREARSEELADELDISRATFSEHLRKAEKKMVMRELSEAK